MTSSVGTLTAPAGTISAQELRDQLGDPDLTVVDVRSTAAYNGWRLRGEARGGHIPGAVAFPAAWLSSVDAVEVERLFDSKGIVVGRDIVIYGDDAADAADLAAKLTEAGIEKVRVYAAGFAEWAADERLPLERLPNYSKLVHTEWLRGLLGR